MPSTSPTAGRYPLSLSGVLIAMVVLLCPLRAAAESGLWTFDADPGLVERHDGNDPAFEWAVAGGVLSVTMTREAATQRVEGLVAEVHLQEAFHLHDGHKYRDP